MVIDYKTRKITWKFKYTIKPIAGNCNNIQMMNTNGMIGLLQKDEFQVQAVDINCESN